VGTADRLFALSVGVGVPAYVRLVGLLCNASMCRKPCSDKKPCSGKKPRKKHEVRQQEVPAWSSWVVRANGLSGASRTRVGLGVAFCDFSPPASARKNQTHHLARCPGFAGTTLPVPACWLLAAGAWGHWALGPTGSGSGASGVWRLGSGVWGPGGERGTGTGKN
jgi:hypothetical protein